MGRPFPSPATKNGAFGDDCWVIKFYKFINLRDHLSFQYTSELTEIRMRMTWKPITPGSRLNRPGHCNLCEYRNSMISLACSNSSHALIQWAVWTTYTGVGSIFLDSARWSGVQRGWAEDIIWLAPSCAACWCIITRVDECACANCMWQRVIGANGIHWYTVHVVAMLYRKIRAQTLSRICALNKCKTCVYGWSNQYPPIIHCITSKCTDLPVLNFTEFWA